MEPLSAGASVITVLEALWRLSKRLKGVAKNTKVVNREVGALAGKVKALWKLFSFVYETFNNLPPDFQQSIDTEDLECHFTESAFETINGLNNLLRALKPIQDAEHSPLLPKLIAKYKWYSMQGIVAFFHSQLAFSIESLGLLTGAVQLRLTYETYRYMRNNSEDNRELKYWKRKYKTAKSDVRNQRAKVEKLERKCKRLLEQEQLVTNPEFRPSINIYVGNPAIRIANQELAQPRIPSRSSHSTNRSEISPSQETLDSNDSGTSESSSRGHPEGPPDEEDSDSGDSDYSESSSTHGSMGLPVEEDSDGNSSIVNESVAVNPTLEPEPPVRSPSVADLLRNIYVYRSLQPTDIKILNLRPQNSVESGDED